MKRVEGDSRQLVSPLWPDSVSSLAGAWSDFPTEEDLRSGQVGDLLREPL